LALEAKTAINELYIINKKIRDKRRQKESQRLTKCRGRTIKEAKEKKTIIM
jgi:hypothetical protein